MDSRHDIKRINVEEDRLSSLPDDLIHKILSFIGLKCAIETSVLSSRWRFVWTSMPCLDFSSEDFTTLPKFSKYVTNVLSHRNNLAEVFSIKLRFRGDVSEEFVKQTMNYAFSHNVQQLNVVCLLENNMEFPLSLFSSQSLKHLTLTGEIYYLWSENNPFYAYILKPTSTWELPALTTLYLHDVNFRDDDSTDKCYVLFSKCANLKNLTFRKCKMNGFSICHPRLLTLTLDQGYWSEKGVNVIAPQLENLSIRNWLSYKYIISAPNLVSLVYVCDRPLLLFKDDCHSLEKVDLCVSGREYIDARNAVCLFHLLHSVKFLTLNLETVELVSSFMKLISHHPSPFTSLKMLKIYPKHIDKKEQEQNKVNKSREVINFLLEFSPSATLTMVSREDLRTKRDAELARSLMAKLQALLERDRTNTENMANSCMHEQRKAQVVNQLPIEERMTRINNWEDLSMQTEKVKERICDIDSDLLEIKELLTKLPTLNRAEMQPCFSSLCAEADSVVNKLIDHMKILCDMKRNRFSVYFNELASTSQPSS